MQVDNCTYRNYNTPFFTSYKSALSKKLDDVVLKKSVSEGDIFELTSKVEEFVKTETTPDRLLGKGTLGKVFKIDSDYVLKIPLWDTKLGEFKLLSSQFADLSTYYGDEIVSFGHFKIMKNVSPSGNHFPVGIPYGYLRDHSSRECSQLYEQECFPRLMALPQKAFDNLASDCAKLNKLQGYMFDFKNPNNFVIVGDEIRVVDSICPTLSYQNNSIANLMRVFIWAESVGCEAPFSQKLLEPRRELFKKIILAGMKNDLPVCSGGGEFVFEEVAELLCRSKVPASKIEATLNKIKMSCSDVSKRLEQTEKYLDTIFKEA